MPDVGERERRVLVKGLEIEQHFFFEWVLPFVTAQFPILAPRLAAGVFSGSQTVGADDERSPDHDWGPRCTLFLPDEDFQCGGKRLQDQATAAAPREFQGYRMERSWDLSVTVDSIDRFLENSIGFASPPVHSRDWLLVSGPTPADPLHREANLSMLRHGPIYDDPLGELSARRALFSRFPRTSTTFARQPGPFGSGTMASTTSSSGWCTVKIRWRSTWRLASSFRA
jgi:hypothetical protein